MEREDEERERERIWEGWRVRGRGREIGGIRIRTRAQESKRELKKKKGKLTERS